MAKSTIISLILVELYQQISYSTCCNDFLGGQPVSNSKVKKNPMFGLGTFPKFHYFLIMKATITNIIGNFEYQNRACSAKFYSRGKPRIGGGE